MNSCGFIEPDFGPIRGILNNRLNNVQFKKEAEEDNKFEMKNCPHLSFEQLKASFDLIKANKNTTHLVLDNIGLTDSLMGELVETIKELPLIHLDLQNNQITGQGLATLASGLNIQLNTLILSKNPIGNDRGMKTLVEILNNNKQITDLQIEKIQLSATGMLILSAANPLNLLQLNISSNKLKRMDVFHLSQLLKKCSKIQNVYILNDLNFKRVGKAALKELFGDKTKCLISSNSRRSLKYFK